MFTHAQQFARSLHSRIGIIAASFLLFTVITSFAAVPAVAFAGCPSTTNDQTGIAGYLIVCKGTKDCPCTFADLLLLGQRIILFFLFLSIPLITLAVVYTGFQYITAGSSDKLKEAKERITKLLYGLFFLCTAYLIVYTILKTFVDQGTYPILNEREIIFPN